MATASDRINSTIGSARNIAGAASGIANLPGIPQGVRDSINTLFGSGSGISPSQNRKDLSNFLSTISKKDGLTRTAHFYVEFALPRCLNNQRTLEDTRVLSFLCDSASLPGVSLATSEIRRYGYGPVEKKPYAPIFVDSSMSFLVDGDRFIQNFFTRWMSSIVNFRSDPYGKVLIANTNTLKAYEVNYKNQYATDILITTVDEKGTDIITIQLKQAYPILMGDIALSWGDTDSIARLPVTFTYTTWDISSLNLRGPQAPSNGSFIQSLIKAGTALQTLASIKKPRGIADVVNASGNLARVATLF